MVTKVPTGGRRGWDTVDSTQTLTGALVTAPRAMEVLPTRAGRAPAGAPVRVPEELTAAGGTAPAGSVRPADIPQVDQRQLQRLRSGITRERRLDKRQWTPGKFRLPSIARKRRSGRDTEVNDRRRLGSRTHASETFPRSAWPRRQQYQLCRCLSGAPTCAASDPHLSLESRCSSARGGVAPGRASLWLSPPSLTLRGGYPSEISKLETRATPSTSGTLGTTQALYHASHVYIATRRPRARARTTVPARAFPGIRPPDWPNSGIALVTSLGTAPEGR